MQFIECTLLVSLGRNKVFIPARVGSVVTVATVPAYVDQHSQTDSHQY